MKETERFINTGYGWTCKRCAAQEARRPTETQSTLPRFFREGEAEDRSEFHLTSPPLARWQDDSRQKLYCPRCGVEEALPQA
ncbi:MAG: hypothetical protein H0V88_06040 [Pyrinomonadaceae bacterium]|nr:hypothetical protein [Pyrinomonadaceae bacterium]